MPLEDELNNIWKEKKEAEKLDEEDTFIPAKEAKLEPKTALIHVEL